MDNPHAQATRVAGSHAYAQRDRLVIRRSLPTPLRREAPLPGQRCTTCGRVAEPPSPAAYGLTIDTEQLQVLVDGEPIYLTATEYALMAELLARPGRVVTNYDLLVRVFGEGYFGTDGDGEHAVRVNISRIRRKLAALPKFAGEANFRERVIRNTRERGYWVPRAGEEHRHKA
jgi:DNA-binding response OmpR family regulator